MRGATTLGACFPRHTGWGVHPRCAPELPQWRLGLLLTAARYAAVAAGGSLTRDSIADGWPSL